MDIALLFAAAIGILIMGFAILFALKAQILQHGRFLTYFVQNSPCSKSTAIYVEKHMKQASQQVILWCGKDGGGVLKSENMTDEDAFKKLAAATSEIGDRIGVQTAFIPR